MAKYEDFNLDNGQFIPTYTGIPLDQIQHTADTLSTRHYQNLAEATQLDILANQMKSKLLPGAKGYVDSHINAINEALQTMAKSGGENSTAKIHALASTLQGDQGILNALQRSKEYNDETDVINKLTAAGEDPVWNQANRELLLNAGVDHEVYSKPYQSSAQRRLDYLKKQDEVLDPLKPDAWESELKAAAALAGTSVPNFLKTSSFQGLTSKKVNDYLFKSVKGPDGKTINGLGWTSYKDTPEYRQQKMVGMSDEQIKSELQSRGEAKVFSHYSNDYIHNPEADNVPAGSAQADNGAVKTPLPAMVRNKFTLPFNPENIDEKGNVKPGLFESIVSGTGIVSPEGLKANAKQLRKDAEALHGNAKQMALKQADDYDKEANEASKSTAENTAARTKIMLDYARTALEVKGHDTSNMSDEEIKKLVGSPENSGLIESYINTYGQDRFHSPYINNIVDEKTRQANEDFMRGNFSQRQFIDMQTGEHFSGLKDENGEVQKPLLDLTKAVVEKKAILEGNVDPKHIMTKIDNAGENFTRALRIQVPDDKGNMKEYLVSQLPGTTNTSDVNENVLYNQATEVPGRWGKVSSNLEVMAPASPQQKELLWTRYGQASGITKEQFDNNEVVLIKQGNRVIITPNYTTAAQHLASQGIKLQSSTK